MKSTPDVRRQGSCRGQHRQYLATWAVVLGDSGQPALPRQRTQNNKSTVTQPSGCQENTPIGSVRKEPSTCFAFTLPLMGIYLYFVWVLIYIVPWGERRRTDLEGEPAIL